MTEEEVEKAAFMKKLVVFAFILIVWLIIDLWFINADTKEILVPYYLEPTDKEKKRVEDEKAKAKQDAIDAKADKPTSLKKSQSGD